MITRGVLCLFHLKKKFSLFNSDTDFSANDAYGKYNNFNKERCQLNELNTSHKEQIRVV